MSKHTVRWRSPSLQGREITCVRYGVVGQPLLLFPTAGGDAEEPERFHLIDAIGAFLQDLRLKVYVVDSIAGQAWLQECKTLEDGAAAQPRFDQAIVRGRPAVRSHHDPRPCPMPPDWSGGYSSIFALQQQEQDAPAMGM